MHVHQPKQNLKEHSCVFQTHPTGLCGICPTLRDYIIRDSEGFKCGQCQSDEVYDINTKECTRCADKKQILLDGACVSCKDILVDGI